MWTKLLSQKQSSIVKFPFSKHRMPFSVLQIVRVGIKNLISTLQRLSSMSASQFLILNYFILNYHARFSFFGFSG
jgi:hypothetical protein